MSGTPEALRLAHALETPGADFSCGEVATELRRQHAEIERLTAERDELREALRDRNHDTAVGEKWRTDSRLEEWFPFAAERLAALEAENAALKREAYTWSKAAETYAANEAKLADAVAERDALRKDAERYRWLRSQHWDTAQLCVVAEPKAAVKLGHCCPSGEYLDIAIDAAMKGDKP